MLSDHDAHEGDPAECSRETDAEAAADHGSDASKPYDQTITELARRHDARWNEETRLRADEMLSVPSLWVSEVYTPSTLPRLIHALRDLGWDRVTSFPESDLTSWVLAQRERHSISWTRAGFVVSPGSRAYYADRRSPLPTSIKAMVPTLWSIPGGVTVLSVQFFVDDEPAARLNPVLRRNYESYVEPMDPKPAAWRRMPGVRQLQRNQALLRHHRQYDQARLEHDVLTQRRDQAQAELEALRRECVEWVIDSLPGKFAETDRDDFPTAVLIVTDKEDPFPEQKLGEGRPPPGFEFVGLGNQWIAFRSERYPGLGAVTPDHYVAPGFPLAISSLTFALRRDGAFMSGTGHSTCEPPDDWLIAQRAGKHVLGLMVRWALRCSLAQDLKVLARARDATAKSERYRLGTVSHLKRVRDFAATQAVDARALAGAVQQLVESDRLWTYESPAWTANPEFGSDGLMAVLRAQLTDLSSTVGEDVAVQMETISTTANVASLINQIWLQRLVIVLTALSVLAAFLALWH